MNNLLSPEKEQKEFCTRFLSDEIKQQLIKTFKKAKQRLIFLDYDGTLVPYVKHPLMAKPGEKLLTILKRLSGFQNTDVVIISGRDKATLQKWFGSLDIELAAEHGAWRKEKYGDWQLSASFANDWKPEILSILRQYVDRLPGSFIEEKDFSLVWHYRAADEKLCPIIKNDFLNMMKKNADDMYIEILQGNTVIEVRTAGVNKGTAGKYWIEKKHPDFILAIGDDRTDEDLFFALPETAYSIKVGKTPSFARYNLLDNQQPVIIELLEELIKN
ncbi:MAG: trehalose-phosphatase [Candidatus Kuenenia sp.]|nr:trehalose-phosphatase [Candidatus Kuenenia hertensis]